MRIPKFMKADGTLGLIAPSYGCNIEPYRSAFENALKKWGALGVSCKVGPNCYVGEGIGISNTPEKCGAEVNAFFADSEVDAIVSCGGGELMCEVLDEIDFEKLAAIEPKWYMGFSDNTNLTFLLTTLCDTAAVYGPCAPAFGMEPWHEAVSDAWDVLQGKKREINGYDLWEKESKKDETHPLEPYHVTEPTIVRCYPDEEAVMQGRILGGCLDCLGKLVGTGYDRVRAFEERYKEDGIIWYLEACDLNVMDIRRTLWQLEHAGWFETAKGFLIGRPLHGESLFGLDAYQAVTGILGKHRVPVWMDLDIGHIPPMMPMINGVKATAEIRNQKVHIKYELSK